MSTLRFGSRGGFGGGAYRFLLSLVLLAVLLVLVLMLVSLLAVLV